MHLFKYSVLLRIKHPSINSEEISRQFSLRPFRQWMKGTNESTPRGEPLEGFFDSSFWTAALPLKDHLKTDEQKFGGFLQSVLRNYLYPNSNFLRAISDDGGRIELFIGVFLQGDTEIVLPHDLLSEFGKLNVDISLDVYP